MELNFHIFRHGESPYLQRNNDVELYEANDLTPKGIEQIKKSIDSIYFPSHKIIEIRSSPTGRGLHSSKIIIENLEKRLIKHSEIKKEQNLGEVNNFSWDLFCPLVYGGEVVFEGQRIFIDVNKTNPSKTQYQEFFAKGEAQRVVDLIDLPNSYKKEVKSFEKFEDVTRRLLNTILKAKATSDKTENIFVTHDGLTGFLINLDSEGKLFGSNTGSYISVKMTDSNAYIYTVNGILSEKRKDIFEEFERRYGKL